MNQRLAAKLLARRLGCVKKTPDTSPLRDTYASWEAQIQAELVLHWDSQGRGLVDKLGSDTLASTTRKGEALLDNTKWWTGWATAYTALLIPFIESGAGMSADVAVEGLLVDYALGLDASVINTAVADWARKYAGSLAKNLTDADLDGLRANLAAWTESHEDFTALVDRVEKIVGDRTRAELISSTESTTCYAQGNYITWKESGIVTGRVWNTAQDELVCPICRGLNQQIAALDSNVWYNMDGSAGYGPGPPMEPAHPR